MTKNSSKKKKEAATGSRGQRPGGRSPRNVRHTACGSSSTIEAAELRRICDPYVDSAGPFCSTCDGNFPFHDFVWEDTEESINAFRRRMKALIPRSHNKLHETMATLVIPLSLGLGAYTAWAVSGILWKLVLTPLAVVVVVVAGSMSIDFIMHRILRSVDPQTEV